MTRRSGRGRLPSQEHDAIIAAYQAGATQMALAQQFGLSHQAVGVLLRHAGVPIRPRSKSIDQVAAIVAAYQRGATLIEVGRQFDLSSPTVFRLLRQQNIPRRPQGGTPRHQR